MDEAGFWSDRLRPNLVKSCQALGLRHHFVRVENVVHEGDPDVDFVIDGVAGKIELKFGDNHCGDTAQVLGKGKGMRRDQIIYASKHTWAGGRVWLLIGNQMAAWLIDLRGMTPEAMDGLATATPCQLRQIAAWHCGQRMGGDLPLALIERLPRATPTDPTIARGFGPHYP